MLSRTKMCGYIENVLNSALSADASTIKQSFMVLENKDPCGFLFIPRYPTDLILNTDLYFRIADIVSPAVFPKFTCIRPTSMQIVEVNDQPLETARGFFYPWRKGTPKRLFGTIDQIVSQFDLKKEIPLMQGMTVSRKVNTYMISGSIGSGKSYSMKTLIQIMARTTNRSGTQTAKIVIIDPKKSDAARLAKRHPEYRLLVPDPGDRPEDFLIKVNDELSDLIKELYSRQQKLYEKSKRISTDADEIDAVPIWIFIDELAAITLGLSARTRAVKDFYQELETLAILSREAKIGLVLSLQEARQEFLPSSVRGQMNCRILLGRIDKSTVQFLFPSMSDSLSLPLGGKGTGIVQINDGRHYGIEPISMPTIKEDNNEYFDKN